MSQVKEASTLSRGRQLPESITTADCQHVISRIYLEQLPQMPKQIHLIHGMIILQHKMHISNQLRSMRTVNAQNLIFTNK